MRDLLNIDENDILTGSPRSKFFDMLFNANKNLVTDAVEDWVERFAAMEYLLRCEFGDELEEKIQEAIYENQDAVEEGKNDFFIDRAGEILSRHE
ncbi:MAG: DUF2018 family protein [Campylobacteraceae bacterium]|jgi:hypothetical protein|nr:DUF2018 family protein [Campylobacteraceae bacterium]